MLCSLYLTNTNEEKEAREDDDDKDNNKNGMINPQLLPLHAGRLEDTAIGWGGGGLVWSWKGLDDYSIP